VCKDYYLKTLKHVSNVFKCVYFFSQECEKLVKLLINCQMFVKVWYLFLYISFFVAYIFK